MIKEEQYIDLIKHLIDLCKKTQDELNSNKLKLTEITRILNSEVIISREGKIEKNEQC
jgi:hypothetical protein